MSRPQSEFHRPQAPWRRPPGAPDGVWEQTLAEDPETGDATVLQRYDPGTDTSTQGAVRHRYFEEVYVLEGSLTDLRLGETFTAGMYAYRHPEMEHGPWTSPEGVRMLVIRTRTATRDGVRAAVAADVPAVKAVTDMAYHHYIARIGVVPQPMEADHTANVAAGRVFVTGDPVTGLVVIEEHDDHLFLDSIAVRPEAHGKGVGRRLLHFVDAHARALGLPEVRLYTNALMWENQKIYPKYGYEVVERRTDGPYDRIHYRKRLD